jgi:hypothetical protein
MDGHAGGYPMMMPMAFPAYPPMGTYPAPYPELDITPSGLNGNAVAFANGEAITRSASHSSFGNDGHAVQSSAFPATRSSMSSAPNGMEQPTQLEAAELSQYLSSKFCVYEFADYMLKVTTSGGQELPPLPVHGIIIARSPTLHLLMFSFDRQHAQMVNGLPVLQVHIEDKFADLYHFPLALKYLYGHPLPSAEFMFASPSASGLVSSALGFAAICRFLQMPHLTSCGVKFTINYLAWDNIEKALGFIYEGNRLLSSSSTSPEGWHATSDVERELLRRVLQYIALYFPKDFAIHTSAAELIDSPRLPSIMESRPSISHTRLASIQFGEVSPEDSAKLDTSVLLSSVLLSIPTHMLQTVFESQVLGGKIGWPKVSQVLRDTVAERERRRIKVRKTPTKRVVPGAAPQLWEETRWEEHVETSDRYPCGVGIQRVRVADDSSQ